MGVVYAILDITLKYWI